MDPHSSGGKKIHFAGNGTFRNDAPSGGSGKANETEKSNINGSLPNDDGIPAEAIEKPYKRNKRKRNKWTLIITFLSLVLIIIFITVAYLVARKGAKKDNINIKSKCKDKCSMTLIETIPEVMKYRTGAPKHQNISAHWSRLIKNSKTSIDMLTFYWTMRGSDVPGGPYEQAKLGEQILGDLKAAAERGVRIRIIQNKDNPNTDELKKLKNVEVRTLDMKRLLHAGIVHTKMFACDEANAYVGSANFDWRALTEVKELGVAIYDCSCTVQDLLKIFETNWMLALQDSKIPVRWPMRFWTMFNQDNPIIVEQVNKPQKKVFWSMSPPAFCPPKRTSDKTAIVDMINQAEAYIYISVMDYYAALIYTKPAKYWDIIDRALRRAVFDRGIVVHLMTSKWNSTREQEIVFIKSLSEFGKVPTIKNGSLEVRLFEMPPSSIPFTRVSHSKYMVTDKGVFISTSNWGGDYFENTGGISLVIREADSKTSSSMHNDLRKTFLRDWESSYAKKLEEVDWTNNRGDYFYP